MLDVDVSVVTYRPDWDLLGRLAESLLEQAAGLALHLWIVDNSVDPAVAARLASLPALQPGRGFATVSIERSASNVGFGRGHNANVARGRAPFLLVLNQDCIVEPGVLAPLLALASTDEPRVAAWELRQIPYEHPKAYDPVSLDTPWVSGAATLFRRSAFDAVGGFDAKIFMYGEDVDLSWRLRGRGFRLRYVPRCAVVHRTYATAAEVKPLQVLGGVQSNLCLRARFGGVARTLQGLSMLLAELCAPQEFPGRRMGLVKAGLGFLARWPHFAATRVAPGAQFKPLFSGWGYELRRDGAFLPFRSLREAPRPATPRVSILIRTVGRGAWLDQAHSSVAHQTWPNLEVVVIEDGPPRSQALIERFRDRQELRYLSTGEKVGRARAGNLALREARGEWLNFLDDDDLLFADHVEVLMEALLARGARGAYALSWETHTKVIDRERGHYEEVVHLTRHRQPFDRLTLWHHNYLPIQAVLFHRSLYERHGGFAEDMDQLEDWNLWTRYTLEDDFIAVDKTTSKYRVPASAKEAAGRQALLDQAYHDALARQEKIRRSLSPEARARLGDPSWRNPPASMQRRRRLRRFVNGRPWLAHVAAWRGPLMRRMRRGRTLR